MGDPATTGILYEDLEAYFRSIEQPFAETRRALSRGDGPLGYFILAFVLSLVPVIPFLLSEVLRLVYGPLAVEIWHLRFRISSFWFWWPASFLITLSLLLAVGKLWSPSEEEKSKWLSPQQMRFAYCYATVDEVRKYRRNHLARHIEAALGNLEKIGTAMMRASTLDLAEGAYPYHYWRLEMGAGPLAEAGVHRSVGVRLDRPRWYRLEPETEEIVRAFPLVLPRLSDRIKDHRDLGAVDSALTELARYLYTEIPDVSDGASRPELEAAGAGALLGFARQINELPPYRSEPVARAPAERASQKAFLLGRRVAGAFTHSNVLVGFFCWYVLSLALVYASFRVAFIMVPALRVDSTVVATAVSAPLVVAITAVTIPRMGGGAKIKE